jgi:hypothetical protein
MPELIGNEGQALSVSSQELDRLRERVRSGEGDQVLWAQNGSDTRQWIYDLIDGTKALLPVDVIRGKTGDQATGYSYLWKRVFRCSECSYTDPHQARIADHVEKVREKAETHKGAEALRSRHGDIAVDECSVCGVHFDTSRVGRMRNHIEQAKAQGALHMGEVRLQMVRRFALEPSVPAVLGERVVAHPMNGNPVQKEDHGKVLQFVGPEAKVGGRPRRRHRRRGRGRKEGAAI